MTGVNWAPLVELLLLGLTLSALPLGWWLLRARAQGPGERLRALVLVTLFLTFDLVLFGAFTRLSDSGLGCPDWPGCYGEASPIGAHREIAAEQTLRPQGPVTQGKAWVEMVHRYWASTVGFLILVQAWLAWRWRSSALPKPGWALLTLGWVLVQGAFGALTVTWRLYPAVVTLHLLFGLGLVALLALQAERLRPRPLHVSLGGLWALVGAGLWLQVALGGWVSTNYAVLICPDFPTCQGQWLPPVDFAAGMNPWRELGHDPHGGLLTVPALTAIHLAHRLGALVVSLGVCALAWALWRAGAVRWATGFLMLLVWQLISGVSNVVLGWPLLAALMHSAGAAGLVLAWTVLGARLHAARQGVPTQGLRVPA